MQKVIFLTGVSKGLGWELACTLLKRGHRVIGTVYQSSDQAEVLRVQYPESFTYYCMDATDDLSVNAVVGTVLSKHEKIDVLVNSAGIFLYGSLEVCTLQEIRHLFEANFFGVIRVLQGFLPRMKQQQCGLIVNISSLSGYEPVPFAEIYCASKAALESLTESLACALSPFGVRVMLLCPSGLKTSMPLEAKIGNRVSEENAQARSQALKAKERSKTYFHNKIDPKEIAGQFVEIIECEDSSFRVTLGQPAIECAKKRFVDPTGNAHIKEKIGYLERIQLS